MSLTKWGVEKATRALLVPTKSGLSGFGLQNSLQVALWGWRQGTERARQSSQDAGIDIIHITGGLHKSRHCWRVPIRRWHGSEIFSQAWHVYGTRSSGHYTLGLSESKSKTRIDLSSIIKPFSSSSRQCWAHSFLTLRCCLHLKLNLLQDSQSTGRPRGHRKKALMYALAFNVIQTVSYLWSDKKRNKWEFHFCNSDFETGCCSFYIAFVIHQVKCLQHP